MNKLIYAIMFLFILGFSNSAEVQAQTAEQIKDDSALLYEVTGNDLEKPSYLFGTIHIVCAKDMISMDKFEPYLNKSDQIIMEIDLDDQKELQSFPQLTKLPEGKNLNDYLTKEQYASVDRMTREILSAPLENFKGSHPIVLLSSLYQSQKVLGCTPPGSYEISLLQYAMSRGKQIEGLETVAMQMNSLNSIPLEKQALDIYKISTDPSKFFLSMKNMVAIYKTQSSDALFEFIQTQMTDDPSFQTNLLDARNIDWIPKIEKAIKVKPTFIAVGAGHLGGEKGVLNLMKANGYKLKPIRF